MTEVGICLPQIGEHVTVEVFEQFCLAAEETGFSSLWVQEHLFYPLHPRSPYGAVDGAPPPDQYRSVWAPLPMLSAAAAWTQRVRLGTGILVGGYHRPVELANALATIDQISGGRVVAGLGVGWSIEEHEQSNVDFATRGRRMDELVAALKCCGGSDPVSYRGTFFDIPPSVVRPKPHQQSIPLVSGMWSEAGRHRTAALFDGWNPAGVSVPTARRWASEMNETRAISGKPPLTIHFRTFPQSPWLEANLERVFAQTEASRAAGFDEVVIDASFWDRIQKPGDWLKIIDELSPSLSG